MEYTDLGRLVNLEYALPSECAEHVRKGEADVGIVPVIEIERMGLEWIPGTGIACEGEVRSILLISKVPLDRIRTLAADTGSRTSVMLSRVILAHRYGTEPETTPMAPDLEAMLAAADAALIIGDPALMLDPEALRANYEVLDLGAEWFSLTGLPMIFALWAGKKEKLAPELETIFTQSCRYGLRHLNDVLDIECYKRRIPEMLARTYLSRHIVFQLSGRHYEGMRRYLKLAAEVKQLGAVPA